MRPLDQRKKKNPTKGKKGKHYYAVIDICEQTACVKWYHFGIVVSHEKDGGMDG